MPGNLKALDIRSFTGGLPAEMLEFDVLGMKGIAIPRGIEDIVVMSQGIIHVATDRCVGPGPVRRGDEVDLIDCIDP